jgi:hypothetical protein
MRVTSRALCGLMAMLALVGAAGPGNSLAERNAVLVRELQQVHGLRDDEVLRIREIFAGSRVIGQGNPAVTEHAATREACLAKLVAASVTYEQPESDRLCGDRYMAPLYDPSRQKPQDAKACIDRFEFPNIPCAHPVVWVKAREAALLCEAQGKRLCDAHEWEGGCAGRLEEADYRFDLAKGKSAMGGVESMRAAHNRTHAATKSWSYGPAYKSGICGSASQKSPGCGGGEWSRCGSNTYPAGFFPECHSTSGVFDLNGNAAEHMNLPLDESQMASRGSRTLGVTEMKGSWFIFDRYKAHEDWCRWRAPYWHGSRVMDKGSHENYHLGFRCCKTIP